MMRRVEGWAHLELDIAEKIRSILDLPELLKLGGICSSWRSSSSPVFTSMVKFSLLIQKNPFHKGFIWIFSPSYGRPYQVQFPPGFNSGKICGFSDGWIVLEEDNNISNLQILRLFSSSIIHLPPLLPTDYQGTKGRKVCLSADQSMVIAIHRDREDRSNFNLYFCRPKTDSSWEVFTIPHEEQTMIEDVIFCSGKFYAITSHGVIAAIDPSDGLRITVVDSRTCFFWTYLTQSSEYGLMLVNMSIQSKSSSHWIEKIDTSHSTDEAKLRPINDIGGYAVFISCHHSQMISTVEFQFFKRNFIYTTADPYRDWAGDLLYSDDDRPVLLRGRHLGD